MTGTDEGCRFLQNSTTVALTQHTTAHANDTLLLQSKALSTVPNKAHVGDLCPHSDLAQVSQLVEQQATTRSSHHQQACNSHGAELLGRLAGVPQLQVTSLNELLQALLTTSKAASGTSCKLGEERVEDGEKCSGKGRRV